ncbi:cysteine-rich DPF motif domain-containing protein 1 isoform X1 [Gadus morhua]|nr:cysteine-rich DPF motif domain-containing protein 1 isoform X1 [Gadus morhua]
MSDVRLSNASPTLERGVGDARPAEPAKPSVCRNLFGRSEREGFEKDCRATMHTAQRAFAERWDYDTVEDQPISTRSLEWEPVESPPEFYVRPAHKRPCPRGMFDPPGSDSRPEPGQDGILLNREPVKGSRKRRSTPLDGCLSGCQTKHYLSDEDEDRDQPDPLGFPTLTLAEQTPRKPESQTNSKCVSPLSGRTVVDTGGGERERSLSSLSAKGGGGGSSTEYIQLFNFRHLSSKLPQKQTM